MCSSLEGGFKCSRSRKQCSEMYRLSDVPRDKVGNRVATLDRSMQRVRIEVVAILPRDDFVGIQSRSSGQRALLSRPATALSSPNPARKPNLPDSSHPTALPFPLLGLQSIRNKSNRSSSGIVSEWGVTRVWEAIKSTPISGSCLGRNLWISLIFRYHRNRNLMLKCMMLNLCNLKEESAEGRDIYANYSLKKWIFVYKWCIIASIVQYIYII